MNMIGRKLNTQLKNIGNSNQIAEADALNRALLSSGVSPKSQGDTMSAVLSGIAGAVGVAILMATVNSKPKINGNTVIIQYGMPLKVFAVISFIFAIYVSYLAIKAVPDRVIPTTLAAILLYLASISLMLEFIVVNISYDGNKIYTRSPWRKSRIIPWVEIVDLKYSALTQWHVVSTRSFGYIRIHDGMNGKQTFFDEINKRLKV